jgi:hypothetical protein
MNKITYVFNSRRGIRLGLASSLGRFALVGLVMILAFAQASIAQNIGTISQAVNAAKPYNTVYFGIYPQEFYSTVYAAMDAFPTQPPAGPFKVVAADNKEWNGGDLPTKQPKNYASFFYVKPLKWRIILDDGEGVMLLSDGNVDIQSYDNGTVSWDGHWASSSLRTWLTDNFLNGHSDNTIPQVYKGSIASLAGNHNDLIGTIYDGVSYPSYITPPTSTNTTNGETPYFTPAEKNAIVLSSLTNPTMGGNNDNQATQDVIYLPGADVIEAVYPVPADRISANSRYVTSYPNTTDTDDDWITRTHSSFKLSGYVTAFKRSDAAHLHDGEQATLSTAAKAAIRPALHLNPDKVLMVSDVKPTLPATPPITLQSTSFSVSPTIPLKLTLVDDGSLNLVSSISVGATWLSATEYWEVPSGGSITLNCSGGSSDPGSYISCLLENAYGIKYYTKAAAGNSTTATVTFPSTPASAGTYVLKVFNEVTNSTEKPDYASLPQEYKIYLNDGASTSAPAINTTETLSNGFIGKTYNDTVKLSTIGSPAPAFSINAGSLPPGLTLNATTGRISGTITGGEYTYNFTVKAENAAGHFDEKSFSIVVSQIIAPVISTTPIDGGYLSIPYIAQIELSAGDIPYVKFTKTSGNLPAGLRLEEDGTLHGTPTAVETQTFTVCAETEGMFDYRSYTISILAYNPSDLAPPFFVTADLGTSAQVRENTLFPDVVILINGSQYIDVQYDPSTFPTGMTFDPSAKKIFGTPILGSAGTYQLHFWAKNPATKPILAAGPDSIGILYTLTVLPVDVPMIITPSALPAAAQGMPYDEQLDTDIPATLSLTGLLPPGMSFTSPDEIAGTPTTPGAYTFTVKATNVDGYSTKAFTLEVQSPLPPPIIDPVTLPDGTAGDNYVGATVTATNSPTRWTWTGAPPGLSLNNSGIISGMPTTAGTYTVSISAENAWAPALVSQTAIIVIHPAPTSIPPAFVYVLPDGEPNTAYSERVSPIARPDVTWSIADGSLPPGLTLSDEGVISGIPTSSGLYKFTVKVVSNGGEFADVTKELEIVIATHVGNSSIARLVTIPVIPGAITVPEAGSHIIPSGSDFSILLTPVDELYKMLRPQVKSNRILVADAEGIIVTPNGDGTYTILIKGIREAVDLTVDFTQATGTVDDTKLWSAGNRLYIHAVHSGEARVYSVTGVLVKGLTVVADETYSTTLPAGIYLVVLDNGKVYKVVLK